MSVVCRRCLRFKHVVISVEHHQRFLVVAIEMNPLVAAAGSGQIVAQTAKQS
jgi:hypothetical protein